MGRCKRTFCTIISRLPQIYHMQTYIWSILIHDDSCAWQIQQCTSWNAEEKCNYKPHADTHTHIRVSPSPYTWPHLQRFNTTEKPPNTGDSRSRVLAPPNTSGSAFIHRLDGRTSQSTLALPPTSFCADTRASSARAPAAGGEARLRGAGGRARRAGGRVVGPGLGAQGGD